MSEKISELLTETRIVFPGVQALLGFQFAAYLTEAFGELSDLAKAVHTGSLLLLALAMILLMTPAPTAFVLAALLPLALGLAGDFYVVLEKALQSSQLALLGAAAMLGGALVLWFGVPLLLRR